MHFTQGELSPPLTADYALMIATWNGSYQSRQVELLDGPFGLSQYQPGLLPPGTTTKPLGQERGQLRISENYWLDTTWNPATGSLGGPRITYFASQLGPLRTVYWFAQIESKRDFDQQTHRTRLTPRIYLQYWFYYPQSSLPSLDPPTRIYHESDWEMAQVRLDAFFRNPGGLEEALAAIVPASVTTSIHHYGLTRDWATRDPDTGSTGEFHVYVGLGSHASFPESGIWLAQEPDSYIPLQTAHGPLKGTMAFPMGKTRQAVEGPSPPTLDNAGVPPRVVLHPADYALVRFPIDIVTADDYVREVATWQGRWGTIPGPVYRNSGPVYPFREPEWFERGFIPTE